MLYVYVYGYVSGTFHASENIYSVNNNCINNRIKIHQFPMTRSIIRLKRDADALRYITCNTLFYVVRS